MSLFQEQLLGQTSLSIASPCSRDAIPLFTESMFCSLGQSLGFKSRMAKFDVTPVAPWALSPLESGVSSLFPVSTAVLLSVRRKAELGGNIWRNQAECQDDRQILF